MVLLHALPAPVAQPTAMRNRPRAVCGSLGTTKPSLLPRGWPSRRGGRQSRRPSASRDDLLIVATRLPPVATFFTGASAERRPHVRGTHTRARDPRLATCVRPKARRIGLGGPRVRQIPRTERVWEMRGRNVPTTGPDHAQQPPEVRRCQPPDGRSPLAGAGPGRSTDEGQAATLPAVSRRRADTGAPPKARPRSCLRPPCRDRHAP